MTVYYLFPWYLFLSLQFFEITDIVIIAPTSQNKTNTTFTISYGKHYCIYLFLSAMKDCLQTPLKISHVSVKHSMLIDKICKKSTYRTNSSCMHQHENCINASAFSHPIESDMPSRNDTVSQQTVKELHAMPHSCIEIM